MPVEADYIFLPVRGEKKRNSQRASDFADGVVREN
jgi:hypothetical protein